VELNLDIHHKDFSTLLSDELESIIDADCQAIDSTTYKTKLFSVRQLFQWFSFQIIRFVLTISTFYFRQQE